MATTIYCYYILEINIVIFVLKICTYTPNLSSSCITASMTHFINPIEKLVACAPTRKQGKETYNIVSICILLSHNTKFDCLISTTIDILLCEAQYSAALWWRSDCVNLWIELLNNWKPIIYLL